LRVVTWPRQWIFKAIKISSTTPSFRGEVKPEAPCWKILQHIKELYKDERNIPYIKRIIFFAQILPICYQMALMVGLPVVALVYKSGFLQSVSSTMVLHACVSPEG
jgi:hypothetical protein